MRWPDRALGPVGAAEARPGQADGAPGDHDEGGQDQGQDVEPVAERGRDGGGGVATLGPSVPGPAAWSGGHLVVGWAKCPSRPPPCRLSHAAWSTVGAYVALTKPRIIELLLVTTLPTMVVAQRGLPPVWLMVATLVGGALAAGGANAINMVVDRDIDRLMNRTKNRPLVTGAMTPRAALVFALSARGGGLRRAVAGRQPALGRAGRLGHPLLRLRLHAVAQAPLHAEHRDRRRGRRGARAGRVGRRDRQPGRGRRSCSSPSSSSGRRRTSGRWPCATRRTTRRPTCPCSRSWPP